VQRAGVSRHRELGGGELEHDRGHSGKAESSGEQQSEAGLDGAPVRLGRGGVSKVAAMRLVDEESWRAVAGLLYVEDAPVLFWQLPAWEGKRGRSARSGFLGRDPQRVEVAWSG
jgi:hypothetical protein